MNGATRREAVAQAHYHCPNGCEKVVFEMKDAGDPICVRCGARWAECDDDICNLDAKIGMTCESHHIPQPRDMMGRPMLGV